MMGTNSVHPTMAIYASPMINTPRAISGVLGICILDWINRVRGEYHSTRLIENTPNMFSKIFKALLLTHLLHLCSLQMVQIVFQVAYLP